jgi:division protein CdvB (Snf7/Vps24/ESCRT-III family)
MTKRLKEAISPTPLRYKISKAISTMRIQQRKIENTSRHLEQRDRTLREKCVAALQAKDNSLASMYANECAEIRKIVKIALHSELALEQVALRLETVKEFGDTAYTMGSLSGVIGLLKDNLRNVIPEVSLKLSEVHNSLEDMVIEVGEAAEQSIDTEAASGEAQRILTEANIIAEQKMKERFPELPTTATSEARI